MAERVQLVLGAVLGVVATMVGEEHRLTSVDEILISEFRIRPSETDPKAPAAPFGPRDLPKAIPRIHPVRPLRTAGLHLVRHANPLPHPNQRWIGKPRIRGCDATPPDSAP